MESLWTKTICPSLKGFSFSNSNADFELGDSISDPFPSKELGSGHEIPFSEDESDHEGLDPFGDYDDKLEGLDGEVSIDSLGEENRLDDISRDGQFNLLEPGVDLPRKSLGGMAGAPSRQDLLTHLREEDQDMFSYFDGQMMKNWAGPEHYRARRIRRK